MNEIRTGDCLQIMKLLILGNVKVQTCVTSPPYFGLRDYGTAKWEGGEVNCEHSVKLGDGGTTQVDERRPFRTGKQYTHQRVTGRECKCGATRIDQQFGLEETPSAYVARLVEVFGLVRELLAEDGTLWLNLGDSYAGSWGRQGQTCAGTIREPGLKAKDLMGMPWRVAFALQADGWYLRSDIIWAKPNPMPESVTDRPTKSHEYIFLLTKSADYFYDAEAIQEQAICGSGGSHFTGPRSLEIRPNTGRKPRPSAKRGEFDGKTKDLVGREAFRAVTEFRNKRTVWTVSPQAYDGAHFATFPPDLILPCVLAGSRPGDIVFDPFMGSGTTAFVAKENGRQYLGCELNPEYEALQAERLRQEVLF